MFKAMNVIYIALAVLAADQAVKFYIAGHFAVGESLPVAENIFHITYVLNAGAAFGILEGNRWLFLAVALVALVLVWAERRFFLEGDKWRRLGAGLFIGGAVGNCIDRFRQGAVIDFLDFRIWPIFNIADMAICVGVGAIIWGLYRQEYREKKEKKN